MRQVIIADDETLARDLIIKLIKRYRLPLEVVGVAENGDEALTLISELRPDIAFLDIQMPGLNGLDVLSEVSKLNNNHTKVVFVTAYDYFEYAQASLRLGAKDILTKPIDYRQFIETMTRVIGYRHTDCQSFNELLEYIDENSANDIGIDECSEHVHISPSHISKLFRKHFGTSFKIYLNDVRIRKAIELLENTDLSVYDIAYQVGYNNLNYFHKRFRAVTGTTPKNYRI
jgi:YesN/AraC family two-component response regulator